MDDNVVFLKPKSRRESEVIEVLSCRNCQNKTFVISREEDGVVVTCAACDTPVPDAYVVFK